VKGRCPFGDGHDKFCLQCPELFTIFFIGNALCGKTLYCFRKESFIRESRESRERSRRCKGGRNQHKPMLAASQKFCFAKAGVKGLGVEGSPSQKNCKAQRAPGATGC
jgi:hypothetical protein